ncbi:MAG: flagellar biosynthesis protein FliC [Candidatus Pacebacteria bacterium]|nr:flagellar biosynthesis protein FliC [Candidatus Paceibacterota bacterium]
MAFQINTNIGALKAYNALADLNAKMEKAQLRLATQKRINSVADDTSGFNVGKSLDQKVQLMLAAKGNVGSAKDILSTAESQLISIKDMVTQIRAKIADASNPASDKSAIANDIKAIGLEIDSAFATTKFNNTNLLMSGASGFGTGFTSQTGAASTDTLNINYGQFLGGSEDTSADGGIAANLHTDVATDIKAVLAVTSLNLSTLDIDDFETAIDSAIGSIGNYIQRLNAKDDFLTSAIANSQASVSRLFDADMALEQLNATRATIGSQAATAMLAQLNISPQQVLQLLNS